MNIELGVFTHIQNLLEKYNITYELIKKDSTITITTSADTFWAQYDDGTIYATFVCIYKGENVSPLTYDFDTDMVSGEDIVNILEPILKSLVAKELKLFYRKIHQKSKISMSYIVDVVVMRNNQINHYFTGDNHFTLDEIRNYIAKKEGEILDFNI